MARVGANSFAISTGVDAGSMDSLTSVKALTPSESLLDLTVPLSHATSLLRRVFTESLLLLRLAVRLCSYLGVGWKWYMQLVRLVLYAGLLLLGFLQMIAFYLFSPRVRRSVAYGPKSRQRLDLYYPPNMRPHSVYPVVIYITGGAWIIGYKAWGALLARRLSEQGVLVACLDYRNFPQGDALDMLEDVNTGIAWVLARTHRLGGDPDSVTLVGQSAGGHLAGLALIKQAEQAAAGRAALGASPAWSPSCFKAFVGVSGAYDLRALAEHLHRRGLYKNLFERIMSLTTTDDEQHDGRGGAGEGGGKRGAGSGSRYSSGNGNGEVEQYGGSSSCGDGVSEGSTISDGSAGMNGGAGIYNGNGSNGDGNSCNGKLKNVGTSHDASGCKGVARPAYGALSPLEAARRLSPGAAALLPEVLLIHGTADKTVPCEGSARLAEAIQASGCPRPSRCVLVPGKTHTAFLLEDPMRGGQDLLTDTVLGAVTGRDAAGRGKEEQRPGWSVHQAQQRELHVYGTLCPGVLCDLAGWVCPF